MITQQKDSFQKKSSYELFFAGFIKQIYPALGSNYFAGTISGNYLYQSSVKSEWAAGLDLFYDASLLPKLENNDLYNTQFDVFRAGVHGGYHLVVGDFTTGLEIGIYVYDKWKEDGLSYHRVVMNQKISKHMFLCLNLKSHYAKADFIELGVGWRSAGR